jgi:hypothetical protein
VRRAIADAVAKDGTIPRSFIVAVFEDSRAADVSR